MKTNKKERPIRTDGNCSILKPQQNLQKRMVRNANFKNGQIR